MSEPASFHVVIERARDGNTARLADAVAARYGIPADQLRIRLDGGSMRVKSNVDRATADSFLTDLEALGAECTLLDAATGRPVARAKAAPAPRAATPPPMGLDAAREGSSADLGAIGSGEMSLSTLDGADDRPVEASDPAMLAASFGPPTTKAPAAPAAAPAQAPLDLFAPPDAAFEEEQLLDLAPSRVEKKPGKLSEPLPPPTMAPEPAEAQAMSRGSGLAGYVSDARVRLAAGVVLAILIGFVPATVVASLREPGAFDAIDREVQQQFKLATTPEDWKALDPMLAREKSRKEDERNSIALGSVVIWVVVGAGVGYVWFRKIDWDGVVARLEA